MIETILDVKGMSCGSCVHHIDQALSGLDGVSRVEVRLKEGRVHVTHDAARVAVPALVEAIEDAGYESTTT